MKKYQFRCARKTERRFNDEKKNDFIRYNFDNDKDIYYKIQEVVKNNNIEDASMIYPNQEIKLY